VGANRGLFAAAKVSRYCRQAFDYPVSTSEPEAFVNSILEFIKAEHVDLIMPVTDWTLGPLSAERQRFNGLCHMAMPSQAAIEFVSDKFRTIELARAIGIGVPKTHLIHDFEDLSASAEIRFPVVVKDRFSVRWINEEAVLGSVSYAYTPDELASKVRERLKKAGDVLLQEFVSGEGIGFSCLIRGGKTFLPFAWLRVREVDPRGSGSSARRSIPLDDGLVSQSHELITRIGFEGIAMVEYKRTANGRLRLMEINGRPWGSIGLPFACGIDYGRYLIDWWLEGKLPPEKIAYRTNLLCRRGQRIDPLGESPRWTSGKLAWQLPSILAHAGAHGATMASRHVLRRLVDFGYAPRNRRAEELVSASCQRFFIGSGCCLLGG
jgi:predicted ATP-grasp superfamily ATP-dependent carboligase